MFSTEDYDRLSIEVCIRSITFLLIYATNYAKAFLFLVRHHIYDSNVQLFLYQTSFFISFVLL